MILKLVFIFTPTYQNFLEFLAIKLSFSYIKIEVMIIKTQNFNSLEFKLFQSGQFTIYKKKKIYNSKSSHKKLLTIKDI